MKGKISVNVELFANLRENAKKSGEEVSLTEGSSAQNLFDFLKEKYPGRFTGSIKEYVLVVNGKKLDPNKTIELRDGDKAAIFPLIGGG